MPPPLFPFLLFSTRSRTYSRRFHLSITRARAEYSSLNVHGSCPVTRLSSSLAKIRTILLLLLPLRLPAREYCKNIATIARNFSRYQSTRACVRYYTFARRRLVLHGTTVYYTCSNDGLFLICNYHVRVTHLRNVTSSRTRLSSLGLAPPIGATRLC